MRKTELSPLESLVVERALGDEAHGRSANNPLPRIQALTQERQRLYAKSAAHPFLAPMNRARILAIGAEIDLLWEALRRQRATRRTQIERALNVIAEDDDEHTERDDRDDLSNASDDDGDANERRITLSAPNAADAPAAKPATRRKRQKAATRNDTDAA
jgi:hypothetical protein